MVLKVCIIGAGPAGLIVLRDLLEHGEKFDVTVYERTPNIGGTWFYTDRVGTDEQGYPIHTSMTKNLRTNIPKEVAFIRDFDVPEHLPSFITNQDFLTRFEDFCNHFNLKPFIQFKNKVTMVKPILEDKKTKWKVKVTSLEQGTTKEEEFDAVLVCNGQYHDPFTPEITGLNTFPGTVLHSRDYRVPEVFAGKTVVIIGGMTSGHEVVVEVSSVAKDIYLSHNMRHISSLPETIKQVTTIKEVCGSTIKLTNNEVLGDVDVLIFCTGYHYNFNFLDEACHPKVEAKKITPLYQHMIHVDYPTLFFIGLPDANAAIACISVQSQFAVATLLGHVKLPQKDEMHKHIENMFLTQECVDSIPGLKFRPMFMFKSQWQYYDELAELGGFQPLPKVFEKIFDRTLKRALSDFSNFRKVNFIILNDNEYKEIPL